MSLRLGMWLSLVLALVLASSIVVVAVSGSGPTWFTVLNAALLVSLIHSFVSFYRMRRY